ncbi:MAG: Do family serine endopeptidase [Hyphomonadaceae bacterium]|nr:Do family serine endopeptidase [Hyphomonadaceae bacterium]
MRRSLSVIALVMLGTGPVLAQESLTDQTERVDQQVRPESFTDLSKRLMPAVVNITTSKVIANDLPMFEDGEPLSEFNPFFGRDPEGFSQEGALGSGFVISPEGLIVTNDHVISGADEINAVFSDGRTLRAELIGTDEATDIAVLKVEQDEPFPFVEWADSEQAQVGDWVMAIGNPFGFGGSVSVGIVSARNRDIQSGNYDNYIQTDAAINSGNSGGPLFNLNGEVLGVNTAIITPTGGSVGLGFSIPSNLARQISDQLVEFGKARRGWFGVNIQNADRDLAQAYGLEEGTGVILTRIADDGPASKADFEVGDLILMFDGRPVVNERALSRIVADTEIGKQVDVELVRDGRRRTVTFELGELTSDEDEADDETIETDSTLTDNPLGVDFVELSETDRRRYRIPNDVNGVLVRSVSPRGPSFGKLRKGDVVMEMAFETVETPEEALIAMDEATRREGQPLLLRIYRQTQTMFQAIDIEVRG